ncbi:MAG: PQQ-binding-like beta-propeller repeat protein [Candidatus Binatia bacterium]|nr:PQQ-binding-like beta-propeller repeat protein [Candidatus Binatia bacterium]
MNASQNHRILTSALCLLGTSFWVGCSDVDLGDSGGGIEPPNEEGPAEWTMLGRDYASTYHQKLEDKISRDNVGDLKLHWSVEPAAQPNGTPVVVNGVVYATSNGGSYAIDADSGEVLWENRDLPATSSAAYHDGVLYIHTKIGLISAVNPADGEVIWQTPSDTNRVTSGYSSPIVVDDFILVGASSIEEGVVAEGATFRGGVIALDRETGEQRWRHYTAIPPYNGATVWSTVTVDLEARHVFGTTGNNYTGDGGPNSDSIFALDLDSGELVWTTQLTEDDIFTILNPKSPDSDFGTNPTLFDADVDGVTRKMLAAGQKSGVVWGLDRGTGEVLWEKPVSGGSALIGGILNTGAYDGERLFFVSHNQQDRSDTTLVALDPATGATVWQKTLEDWVWGPVTIANGVLYVPTWTTLRGYNTETGDELFAFETPGTIASGTAIVDGRAYFGSGMAYIVGERESTIFALSLPGDDGPPTPPTATPAPANTTFTSIYSDIFVSAGCAGGSCHGSGAGELSFASQAVAYDELVGVDAEGPECIENGGLRVDPGNPDNSLLMNKINGGDVVCGTNMPITGMLEPDQIDRIRTWIADGAAND